jgi:hypothetical protein
MDEPRTPQKVCQEVSAELREMASWLCSGHLTESQFRVSLLALESEKVMRFGFTLTGQKTVEGRTHFELRFASDGRLCASMDYDSATEEFDVRQVCG